MCADFFDLMTDELLICFGICLSDDRVSYIDLFSCLGEIHLCESMCRHNGEYFL